MALLTIATVAGWPWTALAALAWLVLVVLRLVAGSVWYLTEFKWADRVLFWLAVAIALCWIDPIV